MMPPRDQVSDEKQLGSYGSSMKEDLPPLQSLDDLVAPSRDLSIHSLESSVSYIISTTENAPASRRNVYDFGANQGSADNPMIHGRNNDCESIISRDKNGNSNLRKVSHKDELMENNTHDDDNIESPYDMYGTLVATISSGENTSNTANTIESHDDFMARFRQISASSSKEELWNLSHDNEFDRDGYDVENGGGCYAAIANFFCFSQTSFDYANDDEHSIDANESKRLKRRNKNTQVEDRERAIKKERLRRKLAKMSPEAARKFKKKLAQAKKERESRRKKTEGRNNVNEDLRKKQDEYVRQQQEKREFKKRQKDRRRGKEGRK